MISGGSGVQNMPGWLRLCPRVQDKFSFFLLQKEPDLFGDEKRKKRRERKERGEETPGAEGGKKKRKSKKKKNKDPNKPKRPQSSYFLWLNANRERIKEENPGIAITELSKKAGEEWKTVEDRTVSRQFAHCKSLKYGLIIIHV